MHNDLSNVLEMISKGEMDLANFELKNMYKKYGGNTVNEFINSILQKDNNYGPIILSKLNMINENIIIDKKKPLKNQNPLGFY